VSFYFSAFGLTIQSNLWLSFLQDWQSQTSITVDLYLWLKKYPSQWSTISLESVLLYRSPVNDHLGQPIVVIRRVPKDKLFVVTYGDGTEFVIHEAGDQVWATWPDDLTLEDTITYFLGPIMGFILRFRGITCLHANAIAMEKEAIAIVGDSGAGKSTTAAAFAKLGYPILSDDIVALIPKNGQWWVAPAYPWIRLWSESVESLFGSPTALPRIVPTHPTWEKRYLDLTQKEYKFQETAMVLGGVYILGQRRFEPKRPYFKSIPKSEALLNLINYAYTNRLLTKVMRIQEFQCLGQVASQTSVRKVYPHADPKEIFNLCHAIVDDFSKF